MRGDAILLLIKHGWTEISRDSQKITLLRPGENTSKYSGYYTLSGEWEKRLRVFSTSTEFDIQKAYSPFAIYAILEKDGDFHEAAKALAELGFGDNQTYQNKGEILESISRPLSINIFWEIVYVTKSNRNVLKIDNVRLLSFLESKVFLDIILIKLQFIFVL